MPGPQPNFKTANEFYGWLLQKIHDGGNRTLSELATFARDEGDVWIKGPAMAALLCWKEAGIEAIVEASKTRPTSKNLSSAYKLLAATAAGGKFDPTLAFIHNDRLVAILSAATSDGSLRKCARTYLADLLQSLDTFDLLIPLGVAFGQLGIYSEAAAPELIRALSSRWLHLGPTVLKEYLQLISNRPDAEPEFQEFFCRHPQILEPMARQVWSQPDLHGAHEPDFVIRRADNTYVVVEIETPAKQIMTQGGQLTAAATHAEKQATDYRQFLDERVVEARRHFPGYTSAECVVVVGTEATLTSAQRISLANVNRSRHNVRIVGFDWLADRAIAIIENLSSGEIEVTKRHRVV
jgi:hypothetical protein